MLGRPARSLPPIATPSAWPRIVRRLKLMGRRVLASTADAIPVQQRGRVILAHDLLIAATSFPLALYLRLGHLGIGPSRLDVLGIGVPLFLGLFMALMFYYRMHLDVWRHTSTTELLNLLRVVTLSVLVFYVLLFFLVRGEGVPRSLPVIQWFVLAFFLAGTRIAYRLARSDLPLDLAFADPAGNPGTDRAIPVLLLGAGNASSSFIRAVHHRSTNPYTVVGILDHDGAGRGRHLHGVPILGSVDDLDSAMALLARRGQRPVRLVVADPLPQDQLQSLLDKTAAHGMVLCRIPSLDEFRDTGGTAQLDLKPVALEDLLGRPQAVLDQEAIDRLIVGRRVLVTGAGGSIGAELVRQIASRDPAEVTLLDHAEYNLYKIDHEIAATFPDLHRQALLCDVRSQSRVAEIFTKLRPEIVFHAAALKHVPMVELNPCEGVLTNAIGTRNVADAARAHGAQAFVQISTDKAVNPTNVMGATKRLAEFYVQALDLEAGSESRKGQGRDTTRTRFMTVRFGNVLGSSGSVVPLFQEQLSRGGPLTVTHPEIKRYFMTIPEAVSLVLHASAHGIESEHERGQVFVLDMGEPAKIIDIARQMIRLAGREPDKDIHVEITGLRPGEKLYEELFDDAETRSPALISGVFMASPRPVSLAELVHTIDNLAGHCERGDDTSVLAAIGSVIPGYGHGPLREDCR